MIIRIFIFCLCFLIVTDARTQTLVLNGSFEEENVCTEYQMNCAPEAWISGFEPFSNYFKDAKFAYHGAHFMGIVAGKTRNKYQRTFVRTQLICAPRKGNRYRIEFFVKSRHNILDSLGIYFTPYDYLFEKTPLQKIKPALYLKDSRMLTGDTTWTKIILDYTADGTEKFMTIANFSQRDINGETGLPFENRFYAYVDLVTMKPLSRSELLCPGWTRVRDEIYEMNSRHDFLQRYVTFYRTNNKLPDPPKLHPTFQQHVDTLVVPDVLFAFDSKDLQRTSYKVLDSFCTRIRGKRIDSIIVEGHTDSVGSNIYNWQLSIERAGTVAYFLTNNCRLRNDLIFTRSWASERPVADNRTPEGRQRNRRVEILLYIKP